MRYTYKTKGTCSSHIEFEVEENIVKNVKYLGGCNGNLQAIAKLVEGMNVDEVIEKLSGIQCGVKTTSCADQLTKALEQLQNK